MLVFLLTDGDEISMHLVDACGDGRPHSKIEAESSPRCDATQVRGQLNQLPKRSML